MKHNTQILSWKPSPRFVGEGPLMTLVPSLFKIIESFRKTPMAMKYKEGNPSSHLSKEDTHLELALADTPMCYVNQHEGRVSYLTQNPNDVAVYSESVVKVLKAGVHRLREELAALKQSTEQQPKTQEAQQSSLENNMMLLMAVTVGSPQEQVTAREILTGILKSMEFTIDGHPGLPNTTN